jgi:hypothetical protein
MQEMDNTAGPRASLSPGAQATRSLPLYAGKSRGYVNQTPQMTKLRRSVRKTKNMLTLFSLLAKLRLQSDCCILVS